MPAPKQVSAPYYNIGQLRADRWHSIADLAIALSRAHRGSANETALRGQIEKIFTELDQVERYFTFPGHHRVARYEGALERREYKALANQLQQTKRLLVSDAYRSRTDTHERDEDDSRDHFIERADVPDSQRTNNFDVLFVEDLTVEDENELREKLWGLRETHDSFSYEVVVARSFQDALIAMLFNSNIQAVAIRYAPPYRSSNLKSLIGPYIQNALRHDYSSRPPSERGPILGSLIHQLRPEVDIYYVTDTALGNLKDSTLQLFRRIFYRREDVQELHLAILRGIRERFETPFFSALKEYSQKPTGVFHAMPISRGNSVFKSRWIRDFGEFYGRNMFLAETSSTTGGLDSLLQPTGALKKAQEMVAKAYGAKRSYFVTNGTSTANKIVLQALVQPGDVVLIDRDCHKSHHYGMMLAGAYPVYLDSYPIEQYSMYGAVPLHEITDKLLALKRAGRLDKVKMLLLTNCTFDGLVYNVERVMERVLAIKPDMIFLWDEAWFAFGGFTYTCRQRTGMYVANKLWKRYKSDEYRETYRRHIQNLPHNAVPELPDPDRVRIRVYSTQSTHKTLSSFRQGSMIHIWDEDFRARSESTFHEAYMTHTSTSPNYQILASLDAGRRQVQFEGYELVERSIEMAMVLRARIQQNPRLSKYFDVLKVKDLVSPEYRESGIDEYYDPSKGWNRMEAAWQRDEFVLDPTKITLFIGRTGVDGDEFKNRFLMDKFNIQINKTSRNTVLLMTNIGTTRGSVAYLTNTLLTIADELDEHFRSLNEREALISRDRITSLTEGVPPLPDFSRFHSSFQAVPGVPGGDLREAYFLAYEESNCEYVALHDALQSVEGGRELVASSFVIPYPPGFPVLVPGQVVSADVLRFMIALDVTEIHGYRGDLGLRVFRNSVLTREKTVTAMGARPHTHGPVTNPSSGKGQR